MTALNSNSYTSQAWLHQINELVASGGVGAIKVSPTAPVNPATGDLWYNPSTGIWGFWQSPYWLSAYQKTLSHDQLNGVSTSSLSFNHGIPSGGSVFVESVYCYTIVSTTNDGSNYWTVTAGLAGVQHINAATVGNFSTAADTVNLRTGKLNNANVAVASGFPGSPSGQVGLVFRLDWTKVGSPGILYASVSLNYRDIL